MIRAMIRRLGSALVLIGLVAGCSSPRPAPPATAPDLGRGLAAKVTADRMVTHLRALQDIANANHGSRADGTPGYDASVEYVAKTLRDRVLRYRRRSSTGSIPFHRVNLRSW